MNINQLTVYKSPFEKKRFGQNNDGGYIVCMIPDIKYDLFLSGGLSNDISFENDFCEYYPEIPCFAFDGTNESLPSPAHENIIFVKKNIGFENNNEIDNLHHYIRYKKNVFIKMDIEEGEYPWMKSMTSDLFKNISQLVIEIHWPYNRDDTKEFFDKLNENFYLVHFHGNNYSSFVNYQNVPMPEVFECTYVNKKHFDCEPQLNDTAFPISIDQPNNVTCPEMYFHYPPFRH